MKLTIYDIIRGPVLSNKAQNVNVNLKKLVLSVHPKSNKPLIKEAIEKLFNVEVKNIRIVVRKGKLKKLGRRVIKGKLEKRALIKLKKGHIDLFGHAGTAPEIETQTSSKN